MAKWTPDTVKDQLANAGLSVEERDIDHGMQFVLPEGTRVNVYSTGKVIVQGKKCGEKQTAEQLFSDGATVIPAPKSLSPVSSQPVLLQPRRDVFIVYGHDKSARDELELLLLRFGIKPIILGNLAPEGQTIIEALESRSDVQYAIVLLTPDDEGHLAGKPEDKRHRARQNVVLELGMFLMKLGRKRVVILHKGTLELPSDIAGLIYISFKDKVSEAKTVLAAALNKAGFDIPIEALSAE